MVEECLSCQAGQRNQPWYIHPSHSDTWILTRDHSCPECVPPAVGESPPWRILFPPFSFASIPQEESLSGESIGTSDSPDNSASDKDTAATRTSQRSPASRARARTALRGRLTRAKKTQRSAGTRAAPVAPAMPPSAGMEVEKTPPSCPPARTASPAASPRTAAKAVAWRQSTGQGPTTGKEAAPAEGAGELPAKHTREVLSTGGTARPVAAPIAAGAGPMGEVD